MPRPPLTMQNALALVGEKREIFSRIGYVQSRRRGVQRLRWKEPDEHGVLRQRSRNLANEDVASAVRMLIGKLRTEKKRRETAREEERRRRREDVRHLKKLVLERTRGTKRRRRVGRAFDIAVKVDGGLELFMAMRPWESPLDKGGRPLESALSEPLQEPDGGLW